MTTELLCYNKGCGKNFDPEINTEDSCIHHPGVPVFHDALKGWSCCKRRTTDFSDFLNIPGCTKGHHSNEKPAQPVEAKVTSSKKKEVAEMEVPAPVKVTPKRIYEPVARPSRDEPTIPLPVKATASLQKALQKLSLEAKNIDDPSKQIRVCKHLSCRKVHTDGIDEVCVHHPGVPVFHEGMKYWSCCNRKTSDFTSFLAQAGCVTGTHEWKVKSVAEAAPCRYDWHQTGSVVVLSIFAKTAVEENSSVKVNQVKIEIDVEYEGGKRNFQLELELEGIIDPSRSSVTLYGTKVEITLKKADASHWSRLDIPKTKVIEENDEETPVVEEKAEIKEENKVKNDDDSDLSGIDDVEFD